MNEAKHSFVFATASPRRIELLNNIKIFPKIIYSSDINEDINSKESPKKLIHHFLFVLPKLNYS